MGAEARDPRRNDELLLGPFSDVADGRLVLQALAIVNAADFDRLKAWLSFMIEQPAIGLVVESPDTHPVVVPSQLKKSAPTRARQGLKIAIGDILEMSADMRPTEVNLIDERCRAMGLPTLSEMRVRFSKKLKGQQRVLASKRPTPRANGNLPPKAALVGSTLR